ncbi:hypothetical protein KP509_17G032300 [Ceratopteris richardii]|uniref:Uncharacterized protein n=1 Tax=Ceratopteris richardii TaxID=49495 RepID=A0A8T2SV80_CERRI|nr:hypothetical protein KP509_17G032300 [Ceratopteris richardii]KAH7372994.1 hypothetical protein KP509_17G032300 [Ceratopteris richardii]KAH7372996.1 hypothetical protein KP509_17G032300 [Ceratopteris richardii]KAH7372997.1 hypothetical protein KP509_17G032300 [Ceratopteris richardii]
MFEMMTFLLASMLLIALVVLASIFRPLKSKYLRNTSFTGYSKTVEPNTAIDSEPSRETCHLCGGLRLRASSMSAVRDSKVTRSNVNHSGKIEQSKYLLGKIRDHIILSVKQIVCKLIAHHRKQAQMNFFTKLENSIHFARQSIFSKSRDMRSPGSGSHHDQCSSSDLAPDSQQNIEISQKGLQMQRLILEILVSSSANSKDSDSKINPSLTLKLETRGKFENLYGCIETLKEKSALNSVDNVDIENFSCKTKNASFKSSFPCCSLSDQVCKTSNPISKEVVTMSKDVADLPDLLAKDNIKFADLNTAEIEIAGEGTHFDSFSGKKHCQASADLSNNSIDGEFSGGDPELEPPKVTALLVSNYISQDGQQESASSRHLCENTASGMAMQHHTVEGKVESGLASDKPLATVGSLQVSILKCKEQRIVSEANNAIVPALASLNVTDDKADGEISSTCMKRGKSKTKQSSPSYDSRGIPACSSIGGLEVEQLCVKKVIKEEVCHSLLDSSDVTLKDNTGLSFRKNKKKKKTRDKKSKDSTKSLTMDAKEMQEIGKIALEAVKHVSAVPERELGCVCGTFKGNVHSQSCPYPFTSSGSTLQRKLKEQYNHLVQSNAAKSLTLAQVGQFTSSLVEAKTTLQQRSESIQRKFAIAKSLLSKADKSSVDRLCGQVYSLEVEQKRLEEDTVVYNRLQEQLKLSPAYQKMIEYGRAHFQKQPQSGHLIETFKQPEEPEISFEELLELEKKDAFWKTHSLTRSSLSTS